MRLHRSPALYALVAFAACNSSKPAAKPAGPPAVAANTAANPTANNPAAAPPPVAAAAPPAVNAPLAAPPTSGFPAAVPPTTGAMAAQTPTMAAPDLYIKYCKLCHGDKMEGYAADNAPSLVSDTFVSTATTDFLRTSIERGRPGTAMAGYGQLIGGPLNNADLTALVELIRKGPPPVQLPAREYAGDPINGKAVFVKNCEKCHGTPTQRQSAIHLFNPILLSSASDAFLWYAIVHGRPGTKMESWKKKLTAAQVNNIVTYLRSEALKRPPPVTGTEPAMPITGPIILNPKGKPAEITLKNDRLASLDDVKKALDDKRRIVIVDARAPSDWSRLHITGSISVPYYDMKALDKIPNDGTWVIAYCACPHHASGVVVDELRKRGYKHSAVLDEGVFAWQSKGYPIVAAPGMLPVPAPPPMLPPTAPPAVLPGQLPPVLAPAH